jgi:hypothetical protein
MHTYLLYIIYLYMHGSYGHDRIGGKAERNRGQRIKRSEEAQGFSTAHTTKMSPIESPWKASGSPELLL